MYLYKIVLAVVVLGSFTFLILLILFLLFHLYMIYNTRCNLPYWALFFLV